MSNAPFDIPSDVTDDEIRIVYAASPFAPPGVTSMRAPGVAPAGVGRAILSEPRAAAASYTPVKNEMLRAGELGDFLDVLIIPDIAGRTLDDGRSPGSVPESFARGLAPEGAVAIEEFVRAGGTLITFDSSSDWAVELFRLPVVDVTEGDSGEGFSCPGSVLRAIPVKEGGNFTSDLPASVSLFFSGSGAYRVMTEKERQDAGLAAGSGKAPETEVLLRYAPERLLLSGWIQKPEVIQGQGAWLRSEVGDGAIHLFAFRPQYRGWSQSTFPLIFRAMLFE